jgi:Flp pilus assembly protein CpaB
MKHLRSVLTAAVCAALMTGILAAQAARRPAPAKKPAPAAVAAAPSAPVALARPKLVVGGAGLGRSNPRRLPYAFRREL